MGILVSFTALQDDVSEPNRHMFMLALQLGCQMGCKLPLLQWSDHMHGSMFTIRHASAQLMCRVHMGWSHTQDAF